MSDFSIKSGSTAPALTVTLYDGASPLNLTGATVRMRMRRVSGGTLAIDAAASVLDAENGIVSYQWVPADTDEAGDFEVEWEVTFSGGAEQVFPTEGYTLVTVEPSLTSVVEAIPDLPDHCWPVDTSCCSSFDEYSPDVQARAKALAGMTMRMLTGYNVGGCPVTLRPCSISCVSRSGGWYEQGGTFRPYINAYGQWVNGCGCTHGGCGCTALPSVYLGSVSRVVEVKVDGVVVPPANYAVHGDTLVRTDGEPWPVCQDMAAADTEVGTFSVSIVRGAAVDGLGAYAAGRLACEFAKACTGKKCALPSNVTSVTRQGITYDMTTESFPNGLTGIREVDLVIQRYNPNKMKAPPVVWSPDLPGSVVIR